LIANLRQDRSPSGEGMLATVLAIVAVSAAAAVAVLGVVHLGDRYHVLTTSGVWIGLADYARDGLLFPEIAEGGSFAGTRYMPIPVVLHAALASLTGEYLTAGKLLGLLSAGALCLVAGFVLRRSGVGPAVTVGLTVVIVAGHAGTIAALSIRPEAVAATIALAALVVSRRETRGAVAVAAVLSVLAMLSKLSAVYPMLAIATWLLIHDRPRLVVFLTALAATLAVSGVVMIALTEGRIVANLTQLGGAGVGVVQAVTAPVRLLKALAEHAPASLLLLPFAALSIVRGVARRSLDVFQLALLFAVVILIGLMADRGSDYNHLLDVVVLISVVVGHSFGRGAAPDLSETPQPTSGSGTRQLLATTLIVGIVTGVSSGAAYDLGLAAKAALSGTPMYPRDPLAGIVQPGDTVLSDDAAVPLAIGQRPVVLDPFMLVAIERHRPELIAGLADRIRSGEFEWIVLRRNAETSDGADVYCGQEFGPTIYTAIAESYRLDRVVDDLSFSYDLPAWDYYLYVPATDGAPRGGAGSFPVEPGPVSPCDAARSTSSNPSVGPANGLPRRPMTSIAMKIGLAGNLARIITTTATQSAVPITPPSTSQFR
jgi:hypothetical protein